MKTYVYVLLWRYDYEGDALLCVANDLKTAKRIGREAREDHHGETSARPWERSVDPNVWTLDVRYGTSLVLCREVLL